MHIYVSFTSRPQIPENVKPPTRSLQHPALTRCCVLRPETPFHRSFKRYIYRKHRPPLLGIYSFPGIPPYSMMLYKWPFKEIGGLGNNSNPNSPYSIVYVSVASIALISLGGGPFLSFSMRTPRLGSSILSISSSYRTSSPVGKRSARMSSRSLLWL